MSIRAEPVLPALPMYKLGAMECASSCIMTYLHIAGRDPGRFLLDYWNLNCVSGLLVSSRNVRLNQALQDLYGIRLELARGCPDSLRTLLRRGHCALVQARASRLSFFPPQMLGHEESGFEHFVLAVGAGERDDLVRVVDPIAGFAGTMTADRLREASPVSPDLAYYVLAEKPGRTSGPTREEMFAYAAGRNYDRYVRARHSSGIYAYERFEEALERSAEADRASRDGWVYRNNVTLSSIVKARPAVWNSFAELGLLDEDTVRKGTERVREIANGWTSLNLLLIKYKNDAGERSRLEAVRRKLRDLRDAETEFLAWMDRLGCAFGAG